MAWIKIGRVQCEDCKEPNMNEILNEPIPEKPPFEISMFECPKCRHKVSIVFRPMK